jgi:hypothetical protein
MAGQPSVNNDSNSKGGTANALDHTTYANMLTGPACLPTADASSSPSPYTWTATVTTPGDNAAAVATTLSTIPAGDLSGVADALAASTGAPASDFSVSANPAALNISCAAGRIRDINLSVRAGEDPRAGGLPARRRLPEL